MAWLVSAELRPVTHSAGLRLAYLTAHEQILTCFPQTAGLLIKPRLNRCPERCGVSCLMTSERKKLERELEQFAKKQISPGGNTNKWRLTDETPGDNFIREVNGFSLLARVH